ncbi:expressed protein [Phakopsora pachyrhizi]|uniref:Expressed protein n=1 Tax=Phakopsora pachyrhizi TaxID=170000 RepID=A0AAV0BE69_PHAPC|nr:expressed protein [Phakopsora pachyrhizi]
MDLHLAHGKSTWMNIIIPCLIIFTSASAFPHSNLFKRATLSQDIYYRNLDQPRLVKRAFGKSIAKPENWLGQFLETSAVKDIPEPVYNAHAIDLNQAMPKTHISNTLKTQNSYKSKKVQFSQVNEDIKLLDPEANYARKGKAKVYEAESQMIDEGKRREYINKNANKPLVISSKSLEESKLTEKPLSPPAKKTFTPNQDKPSMMSSKLSIDKPETSNAQNKAPSSLPKQPHLEKLKSIDPIDNFDEFPTGPKHHNSPTHDNFYTPSIDPKGSGNLLDEYSNYVFSDTSSLPNSPVRDVKSPNEPTIMDHIWSYIFPENIDANQNLGDIKPINSPKISSANNKAHGSKSAADDFNTEHDEALARSLALEEGGPENIGKIGNPYSETRFHIVPEESIFKVESINPSPSEFQTSTQNSNKGEKIADNSKPLKSDEAHSTGASAQTSDLKSKPDEFNPEHDRDLAMAIAREENGYNYKFNEVVNNALTVSSKNKETKKKAFQKLKNAFNTMKKVNKKINDKTPGFSISFGH